MAVALVAGALANKPANGGAAWTRLSWALALRDAGFDVVFVEEHDEDETWETGARWFRDVLGWAGLDGSAALLGRRGTCLGLSLPELVERASSAELLLNLSGHLRRPEVLARVRRRVFVDLDPGYTQAWLVNGWDAEHIAGHDFHFTVGERIGEPGCEVPTGGIHWRPIRQPVDLSAWPVEAGDPLRMTTVASWRSPLGTITVGRSPRGGKVHEFRRLLPLAARVDQACDVALEIHPADHDDLERLLEHGWLVAPAGEVAGSPEAFRAYVQGSGAELSVAQGVYVATRCGWFSDRTVRYLASGKPALVQDTGLADALPVGEGLLTFTGVADAAAAARRLAADYEHHARAARALAEEYFASDRVIGGLLETVGARP
jgi:hypothetical protein